MATVFRPPVYSPRGARSASRVPHTSQPDAFINRRLLLGKDQFFGAAGETKTYDWPNPLRRDTRFPLENYSEIQSSNFKLLKDKFFGAAGQPLQNYDWPNPGRYGFPLENRTEADGTEFWLLAPAVQNPFTQNDWPIVLAPGRRPLGVQYHRVDTTAPPQPPSGTPFLPFDWPNPRGYGFPLENRTEADPSEFWLLKDQFFGGAGQPPSPHDWQNPIPRPFPVENRTEMDGTEFWLLAPVTQNPFAQLDWPNPTRGLTHPISNRFFTFYYVVDDSNPFTTFDYPNPVRRLFPVENLTEMDGTEFWLLAPPVTNPFKNYDWPNPLPKIFAIENRTETDPSEFWLLKDQFFGGPGQPPQAPLPGNPLPYLRAIDFRTWLQSHTLDTLAPFVQSPFSLTDWPNPLPKIFAIENRTEMDPSEFWMLKDTFFGAAGQPPHQTEWPNPLPFLRGSDLRTWLQSHINDTLAPLPPPPFNLDDWQNPRGYAYPLSNRTLAEFTRLLGKDKFFGAAGQPIEPFQQPNPRGYQYPLDLRTVISKFTLTTSVSALYAAAIVHVNGEPWLIVVPAEPNAIDPELDDE